MRELALSFILKAIRNTKEKNRSYSKTSHLYFTVQYSICRVTCIVCGQSHIRAYISKHRLLDADIFTSIRKILVSYAYTIQY